MIRAGLALACGLLATGCTRSSLLLLPGEDGHTGAVAVLGENGETVVDRANTRTSLGSARPQVRDVDPAPLDAADRALVEGLPPPPAHFILYFYEGSTTIVPSSEPQLKAVFEEVKRRPGAEVQVTGHTDSLGTSEDNDRLSLDRAEEIRRLLIADGLAADMTSAVGRGERELLEKTADEVRDPVNRRVEVIVR